MLRELLSERGKDLMVHFREKGRVVRLRVVRPARLRQPSRRAAAPGVVAAGGSGAAQHTHGRARTHTAPFPARAPQAFRGFEGRSGYVRVDGERGRGPDGVGGTVPRAGGPCSEATFHLGLALGTAAHFTPPVSP